MVKKVDVICWKLYHPKGEIVCRRILSPLFSLICSSRAYQISKSAALNLVAAVRICGFDGVNGDESGNSSGYTVVKAPNVTVVQRKFWQEHTA